MNINDAVEAFLQKRKLTLFILWGALLASVLIQVFVGYMTMQDPSSRPTVDAGMMETAAYLKIPAVIVATASVFVRRMFLSVSALRTFASTVPPDHRLTAVFGRLMTFSIVTWALNEAVNIFGLVTVFLTGDWQAILPFTAIAVLLDVIMMPNFDTVREAVA